MSAAIRSRLDPWEAAEIASVGGNVQEALRRGILEVAWEGGAVVHRDLGQDHKVLAAGNSAEACQVMGVRDHHRDARI